MGAPTPGSPRMYRCKACIRADVQHLWTCRECSRRLCQHGMAVRAMRLDGTGYCRACAWRRGRLSSLDQRNARLGLSPMVRAGLDNGTLEG